MPLTPIANSDGEVVFTADGEVVPVGEQGSGERMDTFGIQSTGDPALDRILVRCHIIEMNTRCLQAELRKARINSWVAVMSTWVGAVLVIVALRWFLP